MKALPVALVCCLLLLGACTSPAATDSPAGAQGDGLDELSEGSGAPLPDDDEATPLPDVTVSPPPSAGEGEVPAPPGFGSSFELEPAGASGTRFARLGAHYEEPVPDAERNGVTDPYAEAVAIDVDGLGESLQVTMRFAAEVPNEMPSPDTYMIVGFGMSGNKKGQSYVFGAQADGRGWRPYSGKKGETGSYPGRFSVDGDRLVMTVPWSAVGGPREFNWYASASWFSYVAGATNYSFDVIPNGSGRYPK